MSLMKNLMSMFLKRKEFSMNGLLSIHEFTINGIKIMEAYKKDAIKKFNHRKK